MILIYFYVKKKKQFIASKHYILYLKKMQKTLFAKITLKYA